MSYDPRLDAIMYNEKRRYTFLGPRLLRDGTCIVNIMNDVILSVNLSQQN